VLFVVGVENFLFFWKFFFGFFCGVSGNFGSGSFVEPPISLTPTCDWCGSPPRISNSMVGENHSVFLTLLRRVVLRTGILSAGSSKLNINLFIINLLIFKVMNKQSARGNDSPRKIVGGAILDVIRIDHSSIVGDDYFFITRQSGTSIHHGLTVNDRDPKRALDGAAGSFIVNQDFLATAAKKFFISVPQLCLYSNVRKGQNGGLLTIAVEEKFVGQRLVNEDGSPVLDKKGNPVIYGGNHNHQKVNEIYYEANIVSFEPCDRVLDKAEAFAEAAFLQTGEVIPETSNSLPMRRGSRTFVAATKVPDVPTEKTVGEL
jgi:hypothetical protein